MQKNDEKNPRPVALLILDGWGYAPRSEGNAIAVAHTPYYDQICRNFPMTLLSASGESVGRPAGQPGNAEVGHLSIGTGRIAQTEQSRIRNEVLSGDFVENQILNDAFAKAKNDATAIHLVGMVSDAGVHSSTENLFALLRIAKRYDLKDVFIHCILDGLDVAPRTADIYVEALEIKLADINVGRIATLCGRYFAMDCSENWERTARAYTMLVHAEGERAADPVNAIRNSFLRGISDEFVSPIIMESSPGTPVARVKTGDVLVFFNHRADGIRQLVRSISVPDGAAGSKPIVDTVCLTEYDAGFDLPAAFKPEPVKNTLTQLLSQHELQSFKITESGRFHHLTHLFDGGSDVQRQFEHQILVPCLKDGPRFGQPESESFKITDKLLRGLVSVASGMFVVNIPAADLMAETGDITKTVAAIQYIDTCVGKITGRITERGGVVMITSTHGNCEEMLDLTTGQRSYSLTSNPVPFHFVGAQAGAKLRETGSLEDIAPTVLSVLGIEKPAEMTGVDLCGS